MGHSSDKEWIVIYSQEPPYPLIRGSAFRIWEMAQGLRKDYKVGLAVPSHFDADDHFRNGFDAIWMGDSPVSFAVRKAAELKRQPIAPQLLKHPVVSSYLSALDRFGVNPLVYVNPHAVILLDQICAIHQPRAVICEYVFSAVPAVQVARRYNTFALIDTHDVLSARRKSESRAGVPSQFPPEFKAEHEIELLLLADALIAIQPNEANLLLELAPHQPIVVAEHPCKVESNYRPAVDGNQILFVGSAGRPDIHGVTVFLTDIWPRIQNTIPDVELHLCGIICGHLPSDLLAQDGVHAHGFCPDLTPFYEQAKIVINPAQYGSGLKIKSVEALAHGKCMVTTSAGIDGLEAHAGKAFMCVETDQMAQRIIHLMKDDDVRRRIEIEAVILAENRFVPEVCFRELIALLKNS